MEEVVNKEPTSLNEKAKKDDVVEQKSCTVVDILSPAAMLNAYYICHNVQDLMFFRGFTWEGVAKGKGKGKKKK